MGVEDRTYHGPPNLQPPGSAFDDECRPATERWLAGEPAGAF